MPVSLELSERTSPHGSKDEASKTVDLEAEEVEAVDEKVPAKKSKRRSMRKSTAAAKEAKEAKEAAAASKASLGWATTFTLDGVQYVLKDAAGHPVCPFSLTYVLYFLMISFQIVGNKASMGPVQGIRFNTGLPDFANRFELPDELPEPILITEEEAQQKL